MSSSIDVHSLSSNSQNFQSDNRPQRRKPIPSKGHTKSRRGCFNCKRRRVKCNEERPSCSHCIKAGLLCEYPHNFVNIAQISPIPSPQDTVRLRSTPGVFSMADMRLFHHFITTGYPHLPVGAESIWVTVIPSFAYNYEYLMHSLLALSASHLNALSDSSMTSQALHHRILAVRSLNAAISTPPKTQHESDARFAAALALTFQSVYLEGTTGLSEYLIMIRGAMLIATCAPSGESETSLFAPLNDTTEMARRLTSRAVPPWIPSVALTAASASLTSISALPLSPTERQYHAHLVALTHPTSTPLQTYMAFRALFALPIFWSQRDFATFIVPTNPRARVLLAHFVALMLVLGPVLGVEREGFSGVGAPSRIPGWVLAVCEDVEDEMGALVVWPRVVGGMVGG